MGGNLVGQAHQQRREPGSGLLAWRRRLAAADHGRGRAQGLRGLGRAVRRDHTRERNQGARGIDQSLDCYCVRGLRPVPPRRRCTERRGRHKSGPHAPHVGGRVAGAAGGPQELQGPGNRVASLDDPLGHARAAHAGYRREADHHPDQQRDPDPHQVAAEGCPGIRLPHADVHADRHHDEGGVRHRGVACHRPDAHHQGGKPQRHEGLRRQHPQRRHRDRGPGGDPRHALPGSTKCPGPARLEHPVGRHQKRRDQRGPGGKQRHRDNRSGEHRHGRPDGVAQVDGAPGERRSPDRDDQPTPRAGRQRHHGLAPGSGRIGRPIESGHGGVPCGRARLSRAGGSGLRLARLEQRGHLAGAGLETSPALVVGLRGGADRPEGAGRDEGLAQPRRRTVLEPGNQGARDVGLGGQEHVRDLRAHRSARIPGPQGEAQHDDRRQGGHGPRQQLPRGDGLAQRQAVGHEGGERQALPHGRPARPAPGEQPGHQHQCREAGQGTHGADRSQQPGERHGDNEQGPHDDEQPQVRAEGATGGSDGEEDRAHPGQGGCGAGVEQLSCQPGACGDGDGEDHRRPAEPAHRSLGMSTGVPAL